MISFHLSLRGAKRIILSVIASLNALAFRRGNLSTLSLRGAKRRSNLAFFLVKDGIATPAFGGLAMTERMGLPRLSSRKASQ
jgi:hypothetical protein